MKYFIFIFTFILSSYGFAETSKSKFESPICEEMLGTWYTDTTVMNVNHGKKRDILRIDRNLDGSAYLKGVSIYYEDNDVEYWEFPSSWSCDGKWYSEKNAEGQTKFKIKAFKSEVTVLYDEFNNMTAPEAVEIIERRELDNLTDLPVGFDIKEYLKK